MVGAEKYFIARDKVLDLELALTEENKGKAGNFVHVLRGIATSCNVTGRIIKSERGAETSQQVGVLLRSMRNLNTYQKLLEEHPDFREGEMGEGYFLAGKNRHPHPHRIVDSGDYIAYAVGQLQRTPVS